MTMALSGSQLDEEERVLSPPSKKRKVASSEQKTVSKRQKLKHHLEAVVDQESPDTTTPATPTPGSKFKKRSRLSAKDVQSHTPAQPSYSTFQDQDASVLPHLGLPDTSSITNRAPAANTLRRQAARGSPHAPLSSPFHLQTTSLYLPLPPIALSTTTALPSLLATHLTPVLLTYYPPLQGVVLAISNPVLSSRTPAADKPPSPPSSSSTPAPQLVLAHCADDGGISYVWLTATFLLFRPQVGDELEGWLNVCSEGFVGLICYNYFQVAVARGRIPPRWRWVPPGGEPAGSTEKTAKKGGRAKGKDQKTEERERDNVSGGEQGRPQQPLSEGVVNGDGVRDRVHQEDDRENGFFVREDGSRVKGSLRFRVVDCEVVPGHDRESWSLQVEGTLLSPEEEERQTASRKGPRNIRSSGLSVDQRVHGARSEREDAMTLLTDV